MTETMQLAPGAREEGAALLQRSWQLVGALTHELSPGDLRTGRWFTKLLSTYLRHYDAHVLNAAAAAKGTAADATHAIIRRACMATFLSGAGSGSATSGLTVVAAGPRATLHFLRLVAGSHVALHERPVLHQRALLVRGGGHPHHRAPRVGEVHGAVAFPQHAQPARREGREGTVRVGGVDVDGPDIGGTTGLDSRAGPQDCEAQEAFEQRLHGVRSFIARASDSRVHGWGLKR